MNSDDFDRRMRVFETAHDHCALPGVRIVARCDGRNFTRLTRDICHFAAPFDDRMRDLMVTTTRHLMECGFRISYGYTQSDEISLLFHPMEDAFNRRLAKLGSILAGEASGWFSAQLGAAAAFDCRISQLPSVENVVDYFRWRQIDAHRNALNAHCYWMLRRNGESAKEATRSLERLSAAKKNELLFQHGTNFNDLPGWQRRGIGLFWERYSKTSMDGLTHAPVVVERAHLQVEMNLPMKGDYDSFIKRIITREVSDE